MQQKLKKSNTFFQEINDFVCCNKQIPRSW